MKDFVSSRFQAKANPKNAGELMLAKIRNAMEDNIREVLNDSTMNNSDFMLGFMVKAAIASCVKSFKEDLTLPQLSGLDKTTYDKLVDDVALEMLNKYFEK